MPTATRTRTTIKPVLFPEARKFLDELTAQGGLPPYKMPPEKARRWLVDLQSGHVTKMPAEIEDRIIPAGPRGKISIRIVHPAGPRRDLPTVMYFHGGGWVLGSTETHDRLIREIANGSQTAVVFVNYIPSPESQYMTTLEEAYAAVQWVAANGPEIHVDPSRLAVAGDSVGGNMATVVAMMARERGGPKISFQVLFYPVTDANFDTASYQQFADGYFLSRDGMKWFWDNYLPDTDARSQPKASPLRAPRDLLRGLPPALVITGECDVLRDEGEAYARKLIEAGVNVMATRYLGIIHDFVMLNALSGTAAACAAIGQANSFLKRYLTG